MNPNIEIANTWLKRYRGLSGREAKDSRSMLFIFPWRARWRMCMRGMKFPIHFVWMNGDEIIEVTPNVKPGVKAIRPKKRIDRVLEIPVKD